MSMDDARICSLHHLLRQASELLLNGETAAVRSRLADAMAVLHGRRLPEHTDDIAVDQFAAAMKAKLLLARAKGRAGWETCAVEILQESLVAHTAKGDPTDVANFAMMLWARGESTRLERQWAFNSTGKFYG